MPELPEVETVRRQLQSSLQGRVVKKAKVYSQKQVAGDKKFSSQLKGKEFGGIERRGKLLIFSFKDQPDFFLLGHLKMTGQLIFLDAKGKVYGGGHPTRTRLIDSPHKHTRIEIEFRDGTKLFFNDMRKFGYLKRANKDEVERALDRFGPEPLTPEFSCSEFRERVQKSTRMIKAVLLDQTKIAGLGNIYVDEALWHARIHPETRVNNITTSEYTKLCKAIEKVLYESIELGGTTFKNFRDTKGTHGNYRDELQVFARGGEPCPRCSNSIEKTRVAGRGTHICPQCQTINN